MTVLWIAAEPVSFTTAMCFWIQVSCHQLRDHKHTLSTAALTPPANPTRWGIFPACFDDEITKPLADVSALPGHVYATISHPESIGKTILAGPSTPRPIIAA